MSMTTKEWNKENNAWKRGYSWAVDMMLKHSPSVVRRVVESDESPTEFTIGAIAALDAFDKVATELAAEKKNG